MKKALAILILTVFITWLFGDGVQPVGIGTETEPYQISTLDNLLWVSTNSSSWSSHFIQIEDIDATDTQNWNDGAGWCPIGEDIEYPTNGTAFTGCYNGQYHVVDNLFIDRSSSFFIGLFGYTYGSVICNVGVTNANIMGYYRVGGLVGINRNYSIIDNCHSSGSIEGDSEIGGLVGKNYMNSSITNSFSYTTVTGSDDIGGLAGSNYNNSTISACYSMGNVNGNGSFIGGLVGSNANSSINDSYSFSIVDGGLQVGGLVGYNSSASIICCYSTGFVDGSWDVGGLIGCNWSQIDNSFWDMDSSEQTTSSGGTGKTTEEMKDISTYTDLETVGLDTPWDFANNPNDDIENEDIWDIDGINNNAYPFLSWQQFAPTTVEIPSNVTISINGNNIDLSWDDMGVTSYNIYRSINPYTQDWGNAIGTSSTNSYTDVGIATEVKYFYYITSVN